MRNLRIYTDGKAVTALKQFLLLISGMFILIPAIGNGSGATLPPAIRRMLSVMFFSGITILITLILSVLLFSRFSPVERLKIRKELVLFTRMFLDSKKDGIFLHFPWWKYSVENGKITVDLYLRGIEEDTDKIGQQLSQNLWKELREYKKSDSGARYIFGESPERINAIEEIMKGITVPMGRYTPVLSYEAIPIYDGITWDITREALHVLLIAPTGAGKTRLLTYLGGMVLKRQHKLYVIDAKNSDFGMAFRYAGVPVATKIKDIIQMLTEFVQKMEERYAILYPANGSKGLDFREKGLPGHVLIFDEVLSVLFFANKEEKEEIKRLLGQIALLGRAAGFAVIFTAQKLNATDICKAITEQCQTRIILGGLVSDETFHQVTGMSKKDIGSIYKGGRGKGYAVTPETGGLTYIKTPLLDGKLGDYAELLKNLKKRGTNPYGEGR